jgi:hypothetical protein
MVMVMNEHEIAIMEAEMSAEADDYFGCRPQLIRCSDLERIFEAGFKKAWTKKIQLEEVNAELVEALNKICKACDPHTSHQEAFIVNTVNEALVKAQTLRGDLIITQFKAGDCIPEWVLKAPKKEFQCQAAFAVDVEVHHSNLYIGPVRVYVLKEFYSNDILSMVRIQDAAKGEWTGAPTDWNSKPFNSIKEQE